MAGMRFSGFTEEAVISEWVASLGLENDQTCAATR